MVKTCGLIPRYWEEKVRRISELLVNYKKNMYAYLIKYVFMIYKMMFDLVAMTILESCSKFLFFKIAIDTHKIAIGIYQLKLSTLNSFYFIIQFHPHFLFFFLQTLSQTLDLISTTLSIHCHRLYRLEQYPNLCW